MRVCNHCMQSLAPRDLLDSESHCMEAARASQGLEGVSFWYYTCPWCGHDNLYIEITQLPGETRRQLEKRKTTLAATCQEVKAERTSVLIVEQVPGQN